MSVVPFPDRGGGPHTEGPVRCVGCNHEWTAVTPAGEFRDLECPSCGAYKGIRLGTIGPSDEFWECNCGCSYFMLGRAGAPVCINCGLRAASWADG